MTRRTRSGAVLAALLLPGLLVAGCGGDASSPTSQLPALTQRLDAVDRAVAAHDDTATRAALTRLERTVDDARQSGDLDQQHADQILSAAEALQKALPGAATTSPATTSPATTSPSPSSTPSKTPAPPPQPPGHEKKDKQEKPAKPDEHGPKHEPGHEHGPKH